MNRRALLGAAALLGGTLVSKDGIAQESSPVIAKFAAALTAHDMAAFADLFAPDYVNHQFSAAAPPPATGKTAKQASVDFFAARLAGMPDLSVAVEASLASGEMSAASFVYSGTHGGSYFGVAPTGKKLRFTSCDIFRIQNGKIVEHWGMGDIAGTLAQLKS